jgi:uncharacterized protein (DUF1697 family)
MGQNRRMARYIALLRGINVGGNKLIPMAALRTLCEELGFDNVQTYIQSGNIVFGGNEKSAAAVEKKLEPAIAARFGFSAFTIVRSAKDWPGLLRGNPFAAECEKEPNLVVMSLSKQPPKKDAAKALRERAKDGERIEIADDVIWTHYPAGIGRSKLTPTLVDRLVGSPVTARNYRTVKKLTELLGA